MVRHTQRVVERATRIVDRIEHLPDGSERKIADRRQRTDQSQTAEVSHVVLGTVRGDGPSRGKQAFPEVELDRRDRDPALPTEVRQVHAIGSFSLDNADG
jgi:hypothetical protein